MREQDLASKLKAIDNFEQFFSSRPFEPLNDIRKRSGLPETTREEIIAKRNATLQAGMQRRAQEYKKRFR